MKHKTKHFYTGRSWRAQIFTGGRWCTLGSFKTPERAKEACNKAQEYMDNAIESLDPAIVQAVFMWHMARVIPEGAKL